MADRLSGPVLRDTGRLSQRYPLLRAMGFWVSQHDQFSAIPPPPFAEPFPLGEHAQWRCNTPTKWVSQRYLRNTTWKQGNRVRYPPLRYYLEKVLRDMGVSLRASSPQSEKCSEKSEHCLIFFLMVVFELDLVGWSTMSVTRVFHEGCQAQWMWQAVCFRHPPPWWHVSRCYLYCTTSFDIDALLWHEWKLPGTTICRDRPGERWGEKGAAKSAAKNAVKHSTAEKQLFGIYHDCFHFGPGTLLATRFLDPFPRTSGSVAGSSSAQCNPLSNVMRLNVLKDFIHSLLGAYHDMRWICCRSVWETFTRVNPLPL